MPLVASTSRTERPSVSFDEAVSNLSAGSAETRRHAALDLLDREEAREPLLSALATEADPAVREALVHALTTIGGTQSIDVFIENLRSEDAGLRNEAVRALQAMSDGTSRRMSDLLADEDPDMRIMAVDVLRLLAHENAPLWLRDLLSRETHPNVAGAAVDRMAEIGSAADLDVLREVRTRFCRDPYISFAVELVIKRIQSLDEESRR